MQRLVFLKGFSKNVSPYPSQSFTPPRSFSHFNTSSSTRPHSWPWTAPKAKFSQALYSSPIPKIQISRNTILKTAPNYGLPQTKMGFLRFRFSDRGFSSFSNLYTRRSWFQSLTPNGVVLGLILSNVAVFLLWRVADTSFMLRNFSISVDNFTSGRVHTLVTSAFSHADQWHLISNMIGLYFFGTSVGQTFGSGYLVKLYLSGAVLGSVFYLVYHAFIAPSLQAHRSGMTRTFSSSVPGLGASGAVNAIMLLDIFLFPKKTLYLEFIIPVPAILLGIFLIGKDVLRILEGDQLISGSAHLGGALAAAIAWARIRRGSLRF